LFRWSICSLIFIYAYRETGRPLKAVVCLVVGLGYSMGFATLAVGHLNILTVNIAPILIGLAIDFGIHFITRYEEEIRRRRAAREAVEKALVFTGQGIVTGALTTAAAFLAMGLTHFKGIREMGIISGGGLALCLFPMMTMLPAILLRGRQNAMDGAAGLPAEGRARLESFWLERGPAWWWAGRWPCAPWRPRNSTRWVLITTCSTCRARVCRRWFMRKNFYSRTPRSFPPMTSPISLLLSKN
jgi:uncharacterized membrane protein YdfJ with MMPL/SSD domain